MLRDKGAYQQHDLSKQIDAFVEDPTNPGGLKDNLDYLREIGNFGVHTQKSTNSGEVMTVEASEAEWCLDVLDGLFELYYVGPARDAARRAGFDGRVAEAGRRPISNDEDST